MHQQTLIQYLMKNSILTLVMALVSSLGVANAQTFSVPATNANISTCKNHPSFGNEDVSYRTLYGEECQLRYDISYSYGILMVKWYDVIENCGVSEVKSSATLEDGNVLRIKFTPINDVMANCMCPYDVTTTYMGIEPGDYTLIVNSNWGDLTFEITLADPCYFSLYESDLAGIKIVESTTSPIFLDTENVLHINGIGEYGVEIYDMSGMLQASLRVNDNAEISLQSLSRGVYAIRLSDGTSATIFIK